MKCKCFRCGTELEEDKNAEYFHWRYFCPKCEGFIQNPEQLRKETE